MRSFISYRNVSTNMAAAARSRATSSGDVRASRGARRQIAVHAGTYAGLQTAVKYRLGLSAALTGPRGSVKQKALP